MTDMKRPVTGGTGRKRRIPQILHLDDESMRVTVRIAARLPFWLRSTFLQDLAKAVGGTKLTPEQFHLVATEVARCVCMRVGNGKSADIFPTGG